MVEKTTAPLEGVKVPGIPVIWETNLSHDELRLAYQQLLKKGFFVREAGNDDIISVVSKELTITIKSNLRSFDLKIGEKKCRGAGTRTQVKIIHRSNEEWAEIDKKNEERKSQEIKDQIEREQNKSLEELTKKEISLALNNGASYLKNGQLEASEKEFLKSVTLAINQKISFNPSFENTNPILCLLNFYAQTKKSIKGIHLLNKNKLGDFYWEFFSQRLESNVAVGICKEGLKHHPRSAKIHKRLAIIYEREGAFKEAVDVTQAAINKGLFSDGTKVGFNGRLKRLKKKLSIK